MTSRQFRTAMVSLSKDYGSNHFNFDLKSYEGEEPNISGGIVSSIYVDRTSHIQIEWNGTLLLEEDFDGEELEEIFDEVYYHFMNEDAFGSSEEYLSKLNND